MRRGTRETYSYPNSNPLMPAHSVRAHMKAPGRTNWLSSTSKSSASSLCLASSIRSKSTSSLVLCELMSGSAAVSLMLYSWKASSVASLSIILGIRSAVNHLVKSSLRSGVTLRHVVGLRGRERAALLRPEIWGRAAGRWAALARAGSW